MKIAIILQVRVTSTRLPGKVLMDIGGKPMLWYVIYRLRLCQKIDDIILAIPDTRENDVLEKFAKDNQVKYFRGSEEDVLSRYYEAAEYFKIDQIVRVTSDCPLIDPEITDKVIEKHLNSGADYTSNFLKRSFPKGLDVEVFSFKVLETTHEEAKEHYQREHVDDYMYENPEKFRLVGFENDKNFSYMRWTVDEMKDLEFVREVYKRLYKENEIFLMKDIIGLLKKYPELMEINKDVK